MPAAFRRLTSLLGLGMVFVLMASAMDAVVWTYQMQRSLHEKGHASQPLGRQLVDASRPPNTGKPRRKPEATIRCCHHDPLCVESSH